MKPFKLTAGVFLFLGILLCFQKASSGMQEACCNQDTQAMEQCLQNGHVIDALYGNPPKTALQHAAGSSRTESVKFLLEKGANPNVAGPDGDTSLHDASFIGDAHILGLLIAKSSDINVRNDKWQSPLLLSTCDFDYPEVARVLLEAGANVNKPDDEGEQPLSACLRNADHPRTSVPILISHGASIQRCIDFLELKGLLTNPKKEWLESQTQTLATMNFDLLF